MFDKEFVKSGSYRVETKNFNLATALRFLGFDYSREFEYSNNYKKIIYFYVFEDTSALRAMVEQLLKLKYENSGSTRL